MADNLGYTPGAGATVAADDIGGIHHQLIKVEYGAADSATQVSETSPLPTQSGRIAAATITNVASSASSVSLLASNTARRGVTLYNDTDKACYVKFGATASTTSFTVKLQPNAYYEMPEPIYTGAIDGIWDSAPTGSMRITEF